MKILSCLERTTITHEKLSLIWSLIHVCYALKGFCIHFFIGTIQCYEPKARCYFKIHAVLIYLPGCVRPLESGAIWD